jgi:hypothetical protein
MCHWLKFKVELHGAYKSIKGVNMKCISSRAPWFFSATFLMTTLGSAILHFGAKFLNHKSSTMTHPLSKWEKGRLHLPSSVVGNVHWVNSTRVACWSSFSMCGIHFVKTYFSLAVREWNMLAGDIFTPAAVSGHTMLQSSSSTARMSHVSCLVIADMPLKCIFVFSHPSPANNFLQWGWVPSRLCKGPWLSCLPKQEVKLHHSANVGVQETSLVYCSAEGERTEQKVKEWTNSFFLPSPTLVTMWLSHTERFWNNMVCEWKRCL